MLALVEWTSDGAAPDVDEPRDVVMPASQSLAVLDGRTLVTYGTVKFYNATQG